MNGQQGAEQHVQGSQESHLSYLLNAANGQAGALMGYGLGGGQRLGGYGAGDASLEEQILQRASALRAEALMQQQQHHQRQQHLGAALAALQQQQQLSSLGGLNPNHLAALSAQEQEALLGRAAALRELGISNGSGNALSGVGMERLQQLELGRLEDLERRRQQLAALAGYSGAAAGTPRPNEIPSGGEQLAHDSFKSDGARAAVEKGPAATGAAEKTKEELRKTPGTVIVPCRARGMPMDHNFKTAYFVISEDAKHGEDLVCSYFACRNGGVKFRYCAHCMAPVAKRNFCRRHDHGMSAKGELKDEDEDDASMEGNESKTHETSAKPMDVKKSDAAPVSSLDVLSKAASSMPPSSSKSREKESKLKRRKPSEEDDEVEPDLTNISKKRHKMWSALLIKRPRTKDPRHLSSWLNEVLTVSDFDTPFEENETSESKSQNGGRPSKKLKSDKDSEGGPSSKKERKSTGEKKKRKPDKIASEKTENSKLKKEKPESKKKVKSLSKEKPVKPKEAAKPKETTKSEWFSKERDSAKDHLESPIDKDSKKDIEKDEAPKLPVDPVEDEEEDEVEDESKPEVYNGEEEKKQKETSPTGEDEPEDGEKMENKSESKAGEDSPGKKDDDGFVGSFADWRDRKKDKAKKGTGSLKK